MIVSDGHDQQLVGVVEFGESLQVPTDRRWPAVDPQRSRLSSHGRGGAIPGMGQRLFGCRKRNAATELEVEEPELSAADEALGLRVVLADEHETADGDARALEPGR